MCLYDPVLLYIVLSRIKIQTTMSRNMVCLTRSRLPFSEHLFHTFACSVYYILIYPTNWDLLISPDTTSYDGFETFWTGEPVTTAECSGNTAMLVSFKCDRDSVWEPGKQNVTKYLDTIFRIDCAVCDTIMYISVLTLMIHNIQVLVNVKHLGASLSC